MEWPQHNFAGQRVAICNRYIELFRKEHNEKPDAILFNSLRERLDDILPQQYHDKRLIWLTSGNNWAKVLTNVLDEDREEATSRKDEALTVLKRFQKWQREEYEPTIKRLFKEKGIAEKDCKLDTFHNPTLADFKINGLPSKNPLNASTNIAYLQRLERLNSGISESDQMTLGGAKADTELSSMSDNHWDNKLDKESMRLTVLMPEPNDPPEDFTSFSDQVDPNNYATVTTNEISVVNDIRNDATDAHVVDDKGTGHFNTDLEHLFDTEINAGVNFGAGGVWSLANDLNTLASTTTDKIYIAAAWSSGVGGPLYLMSEVQGGIRYNSTFHTGFGVNTRRYMTVSRDESIGAFGQLKNSIYSDVDRITLAFTQTMALHAKIDFRYVGGWVHWHDGTGGTFTFDTRNLDLQEAVAAAGRRRRMISRGN